MPLFDNQDYDAMVKLVQTLEMLPTCDLATQPMIQFHYSFALNRYAAAELKLNILMPKPCGKTDLSSLIIFRDPTFLFLCLYFTEDIHANISYKIHRKISIVVI